jgi:hypothetical protein
VVERAREVLAELEGTAAAPPAAGSGGAPRAAVPAPELQLALFDAPPHPALLRLRGTDVHNLTPIQALVLLAELVETARR